MMDQHGIPPNENRIKDSASVHPVIGRLDHKLQDTVCGSSGQQLIAHAGNRLLIRGAHPSGPVKLFPVQPDGRGRHDLRNIEKIGLPRLRQYFQPVSGIAESGIPLFGPRAGKINIFHSLRNTLPEVLRAVQPAEIKLPLAVKGVYGRCKIYPSVIKNSLSGLRSPGDKGLGGSEEQSEAQGKNQKEYCQKTFHRMVLAFPFGKNRYPSPRIVSIRPITGSASSSLCLSRAI